MEYFLNKVAVITGASSGIGKAIALALSDKKATICLIGRNIKALNAVACAAKDNTNDVRIYPIDLTIDSNISKLTTNLKDIFGRVDILVHGAGAISIGEVESSPINDFDQQFRLNVRTPYLLTQSLLPMIKKHRGQIVFINSSVGIMKGRAKLSQYGATKHALKVLTDSLREEVNVYGVRVLSVYPGRTATPMQEKICEIEDRIYNPERLLQPEDIASIVVFSLSMPATAEITDILIRPMLKT